MIGFIIRLHLLTIILIDTDRKHRYIYTQYANLHERKNMRRFRTGDQDRVNHFDGIQSSVLVRFIWIDSLGFCFYKNQLKKRY